MVEDYRIKFHTGRAELTGQYTVNRRGNTKAITKYIERYSRWQRTMVQTS